MASLSKLIGVLNRVSGSGYPAHFAGPDGKYYSIGRVITTETDIDSGHMFTVIELVEIEKPKFLAGP